jgi:hypothetical protein
MYVGKDESIVAERYEGDPCRPGTDASPGGVAAPGKFRDYRPDPVFDRILV